MYKLGAWGSGAATWGVGFILWRHHFLEVGDKDCAAKAPDQDRAHHPMMLPKLAALIGACNLSGACWTVSVHLAYRY